MLRLYSKGCEYAIRALIEFPSGPGQPFAGVRKASARARVPEPFLRKMFQRLANKGLLKAIRGPGGGYRLARRPENIALLDVIRAVDGEEALDACVLGLPACSDKSSCALHSLWVNAKKRLLPALAKTSLRDLRHTEED